MSAYKVPANVYAVASALLDDCSFIGFNDSGGAVVHGKHFTVWDAFDMSKAPEVVYAGPLLKAILLMGAETDFEVSGSGDSTVDMRWNGGRASIGNVLDVQTVGLKLLADGMLGNGETFASVDRSIVVDALGLSRVAGSSGRDTSILDGFVGMRDGVAAAGTAGCQMVCPLSKDLVGLSALVQHRHAKAAATFLGSLDSEFVNMGDASAHLFVTANGGSSGIAVASAVTQNQQPRNVLDAAVRRVMAVPVVSAAQYDVAAVLDALGHCANFLVSVAGASGNDAKRARVLFTSDGSVSVDAGKDLGHARYSVGDAGIDALHDMRSVTQIFKMLRGCGVKSAFAQHHAKSDNGVTMFVDSDGPFDAMSMRFGIASVLRQQ